MYQINILLLCNIKKLGTLRCCNVHKSSRPASQPASQPFLHGLPIAQRQGESAPDTQETTLLTPPLTGGNSLDATHANHSISRPLLDRELPLPQDGHV